MEHDREANFIYIFINQLLLDLNDCDVGVRIGDMLYNSMAYADDITVFSTNDKDLQCLISLRNVETMEILGNVFNSKGNNTSHVDNRLNMCRQSFYGSNILGMSYPGVAPEVGSTSSLIYTYYSLLAVLQI